MVYQLFHRDGGSALFSKTALIKAGEAEHIANASDVLDRASAIMAECTHEKAEAQKLGRLEGYTEIKTDIADIISDAVKPIIETLHNIQENQRQELAAVTYSALHEILGEFSASEKMAAVTQRVLQRIDQDNVEVVLLSREVAERVMEQLPHSAADLVQIDENMGPTGCKIHTHSGTVIGSLDVQLNALAARWGLDGEIAHE